MDEKPAKKPRAKTTSPKKKTAPKKAAAKNDAASHLTEPIAPTQEPWDSEAIKDTITRGLGIPEELATSANESTNTIAPQSISSAQNNTQTDNTREDSTEDRPDAGTAGTTTKADSQTEVEKGGDVSVAVAEAGSFPGADLLDSTSRARLPGEKKHEYWERMRKSARLAGLPRGQGVGTAYQWATAQTDREFPPPVPVIVAELVDDDENPTFSGFADEKVSPIGDKTEVAVEAHPAAKPAKSDGQDVSGLSDLPDDWPQLPPNASLQVEIAWVSANRLRVRIGTGVDLSRALSPAPSYSALSWLETSILFPSKFADISVKATASQDDEKEFVKREKLAIEEIRSILKEMIDAKNG